MNNNISNIVNKYKNKYGTDNPFELADYMNVIYQIGNLGDKSGCYMYLKKHRCIFLSNSLDDKMLKVVMAHELCHAIMDTKTNCYFINNKTLLLNNKIEKRANIFAAELLISDNIINEYADYSINQIACATGYNKNLVRLKFENMSKKS